MTTSGGWVAKRCESPANGAMSVVPLAFCAPAGLRGGLGAGGLGAQPWLPALALALPAAAQPTGGSLRHLVPPPLT